ncbi:MAG: hypothetical protein UV35_C0015G0015 [candidate division WWE3 bacterium GW2011_GWB1_42_6]|uniref:DUF4145 domain-containing protein n=1 Tax=candidate division WWE3 bacterium GW2011_GWB1_42_6 TaxID=1619115 RepID=A0A0G1AZN4_UNCKA|nr:MAG: hypothetical protein UV35_C0015G0015 [candidate division WWE3 bacterium GW2011_GWB1_42_6]
MLKGSEPSNSTPAGAVKILWANGFFKENRTLNDVAKCIKTEWGHNFSSSDLSKALKKASFLIRKGRKHNFKHIQKTSFGSGRALSIADQLFSAEIVEKLNKNFTEELRDLRLNFGNSGTCTAFLLRKILEKLIYIVFAKNGIESKLDDKNRKGSLVGLEKMIDLASIEKISGLPLLTSATAKKIKGIKFLGDSSAHNPLVNVDMETILPQMPYIITAYKELLVQL